MGKQEHPIIEIIWRACRRGRRGPKSITISKIGADAIRAEVRRAIRDGDSAACFDAALILIGFLSSRDEAKEAVCELNRLQAELMPEIEAAIRTQKAAASGPVKLGVGEHRAEMFGAPAPEGTVKNRDLRPLGIIR
jgi:hypothetical protein